MWHVRLSQFFTGYITAAMSVPSDMRETKAKQR